MGYKMKQRTIFTIIMLLLLSGSLFAGITVDIRPPVAPGEPVETMEMIVAAVTAGVEQAGASVGTGGMLLETWFRKEQSFYHVKMVLSGGGDVITVNERFSEGNLPVLLSGLTTKAKQVVMEVERLDTERLEAVSAAEAAEAKRIARVKREEEARKAAEEERATRKREADLARKRLEEQRLKEQRGRDWDDFWDGYSEIFIESNGGPDNIWTFDILQGSLGYPKSFMLRFFETGRIFFLPETRLGIGLGTSLGEFSVWDGGEYSFQYDSDWSFRYDVIDKEEASANSSFGSWLPIHVYLPLFIFPDDDIRSDVLLSFTYHWLEGFGSVYTEKPYEISLSFKFNTIQDQGSMPISLFLKYENIPAGALFESQYDVDDVEFESYYNYSEEIYENAYEAFKNTYEDTHLFSIGISIGLGFYAE